MTPDQDPPEVIQASPTSQPVRCDSDPKIHLVVSLVTKVHPMMHVLCTRKGAQRRPQAQLAPLVKHSNAPPPPPPPPPP